MRKQRGTRFSLLQPFLLKFSLCFHLHWNNFTNNNNTDTTEADSIQPEVLLFSYEKKRRPRITDQNLEQEIARLGFWLLWYPPPTQPCSLLWYPELLHFHLLLPFLTLVSIVVKSLHISSNWVRYERRGEVVSLFQQLLLPLCRINLFMSAASPSSDTTAPCVVLPHINRADKGDILFVCKCVYTAPCTVCWGWLKQCTRSTHCHTMIRWRSYKIMHTIFVHIRMMVVQQYKYPGTIIDNKLSFESHVDAVWF